MSLGSIITNGVNKAKMPQRMLRKSKPAPKKERSKSLALPRILLVDDDPGFGKIMQRTAVARGTPLTFCESLDEMSKLTNWNFDIAIIDYDLGLLTGCELTSYLESFAAKELPVILVSQTERLSKDEWPPSIYSFVHKMKGANSIIDVAIDANDARS